MMRIAQKILLYVIALLFLLFAAYPFLYMVATSLKSQSEFFTHPVTLLPSFNIENYLLVFELGMSKYFMNSIIVSVISVFVTVILAAMAAYPHARMRFRLNRPLFLLILAGMMIPVHTTLIPIFILSKEIGLYDTLGALIGPYIAFSLPISVFILTQFMQEIPKELEEAGRMDGCTHFGLFWKILFPLLTPAIATIAIYNAIHIWNEFVFALVLTTSPSNMTLPLGLREFYGEFMINIPGIMAALTLGTLPLLIVYFVAQEKVVRGLSAGAMKG
jgi:raffinose/stachyose/melibiose transport system permease protein